MNRQNRWWHTDHGSSDKPGIIQELFINNYLGHGKSRFPGPTGQSRRKSSSKTHCHTRQRIPGSGVVGTTSQNPLLCLLSEKGPPTTSCESSKGGTRHSRQTFIYTRDSVGIRRYRLPLTPSNPTTTRRTVSVRGFTRDRGRLVPGTSRTVPPPPVDLHLLTSLRTPTDSLDVIHSGYPSLLNQTHLLYLLVRSRSIHSSHDSGHQSWIFWTTLKKWCSFLLVLVNLPSRKLKGEI